MVMPMGNCVTGVSCWNNSSVSPFQSLYFVVGIRPPYLALRYKLFVVGGKGTQTSRIQDSVSGFLVFLGLLFAGCRAAMFTPTEVAPAASSLASQSMDVLMHYDTVVGMNPVNSGGV